MNNIEVNLIRPEFVTNEIILKWDDILNNDPLMPKEFLQEPLIKEVCYAGLWLIEKLKDLECPDEIITKIQITAGKLSFGKNFWEVHEKILNDYIDNKLIFEDSEQAYS
jgi:hypothetical protein